MENLPEKQTNNLPAKVGTNLLNVYTRPPGTKAIDIRRQMVEVPEVAKALNSVDKFIFAASTKTLISELDDQKLVEKTKQLFRFIAMDVGFQVPNDPTDWAYICTRLLDLLKKYFASLSLADIKLAFEMAAMGELNEHLPKDRNGEPDKNHYQQFNAEYFGKILNAYKKKQGEVIHKAMKALPEPEHKPSEKELAYYHNQTLDSIKNAYLRYKDQNEFVVDGLLEMFIYNLLEKNNLVEPIKQTKEDREKALAVYLRRAAEGKVNQYTARQVRNEGINSKEIDFTTFEIARIREIKKAFDRMIAEDVDINQYLNYK